MTDPTPPPISPEEAAAIAAADAASPKDKDSGSSVISPFRKTPRSEWKYTNHENDGKTKYGMSRDVVGYGKQPVNPHWPRSAKVALNFVINFEEGGEMCTLHGDNASECLLTDIGPGCTSLGEFLICVLCPLDELPMSHSSTCFFSNIQRANVA
jgi:hypothetical protein